MYCPSTKILWNYYKQLLQEKHFVKAQCRKRKNKINPDFAVQKDSTVKSWINTYQLTVQKNNFFFGCELNISLNLRPNSIPLVPHKRGNASELF